MKILIQTEREHKVHFVTKHALYMYLNSFLPSHIICIIIMKVLIQTERDHKVHSVTKYVLFEQLLIITHLHIASILTDSNQLNNSQFYCI